MIIKYKITSIIPEGAELKSATESDLHYILYTANIEIVFDSDNALCLDWGWIPLFDFLLAAAEASKDLVDKKDSYIDFTENELMIILSRSGELVNITTNFSSEKYTISVNEFNNSVNECLLRAINDTDIKNKNFNLYRYLNKRRMMAFE